MYYTMISFDLTATLFTDYKALMRFIWLRLAFLDMLVALGVFPTEVTNLLDLVYSIDPENLQ